MNCPCCGQGVNTKVCSVCKERKPLAEFSRSRLGRLGRKAACKGCAKLRDWTYEKKSVDSEAGSVHRM